MENENFGQQTTQQSYYQPPIPEKKLFKNQISFTSGGLLIYSAVMYTVVFAVMFVVMFVKAFIAGI